MNLPARLLHLAESAALWPLSLLARRHYALTPPGTLTGSLTIRWYRPDLFVYTPDPAAPLRFTRSTGEIVQPLEMYTDGGSIPRLLWVFRNYSPWGYGPAFVIHDWLFHLHNCQLQGYPAYSLTDAAKVMSEVMKTLMRQPGFDYGSALSMYLMYLAVRSPPAQRAWDHGPCLQAPVAARESAPDATIVIRFP
jgi:hypothetical protein